MKEGEKLEIKKREKNERIKRERELFKGGHKREEVRERNDEKVKE